MDSVFSVKRIYKKKSFFNARQTILNYKGSLLFTKRLREENIKKYAENE